MIQNNRTLLEKADLAIADLASGGQLRAAQAAKFIRLAIRQSVLMNEAFVTPMAAFQEDRDKFRFSSRVLKPGTEAVALPVGQRSTPALSRVTLDAQLFRAEARMSEEVLEDQIERGAFKDTIMSGLASAISRDMETVVVNGDTASADVLLAVLDGTLEQVTANVVDALNVRLTKDLLRDLYKALDDEFSNFPNLRFWTNRQARVDYRDSLADRATELGDSELVGPGSRTAWNDIPVVMVPEFPPTAETGGSVTQVLLTTPDNIMIGVLRKVRIQTQIDAPAGVFIIVASVRFDVKVVEDNAAAKLINVLGT